MTTATERPDAAPREGLIARHPLVSFFLLTFVFSWVYWGLWKALQLPESLFVVGCSRTNCLGLPRASHHLGKARSAWLVAQLCALASWRAMVPGDPDRLSGSDVIGFCGPTREPC